MMPKDALGQELSAGDYVAYPAMANGQLIMCFGVVKELAPCGPGEAPRAFIITSTNRITDRYGDDLIALDPGKVLPETVRLLKDAMVRRGMN